MFPVQQLEFCVSGDSDYKTELTKLYIPKGLLDEIISQIKLQETRTGIPEIPGYYKISNKYKWDPQRLKGYQGHNFDVKHVDNFHRSTSELTARVIQREYEKERRWQIQEKQLLGRPNDDFCKKTLVELKQCLSISQNEKLKNEEIKKHEVEMMKDHIHEELLWCKREKELTKELEMAKGMFFQLLDVREREAAEDKEAFKQHQERLENVLTELLKKYWRKQHTKVFREERIHCMWGSGKNNQEGFENFWNPFLHKFYIVNAGFRCSKKVEEMKETKDHKERESEMLSLQKNERQTKIKPQEKKEKQHLFLKSKKATTPIESSKISNSKEENKSYCCKCHRAIVSNCCLQRKFEQKSVRSDLSKNNKQSAEQTFLSRNDKVVEYTSGSPSKEISIDHWISSHDHEKKCYCNPLAKYTDINHTTQFRSQSISMYSRSCSVSPGKNVNKDIDPSQESKKFNPRKNKMTKK
ncbi:uncharacterized protein LOC143258511 isoform X3 [Tachypleus tridentatus]|uniref:uncharacterized protein LOC143258511 isoform X3 n=1 Tax=Tachypleus tridentatus TaxID=6853 RepID=UPI003FD15E90